MSLPPSAGANLVECKDEVREKLGMWLSEQLGEADAYLDALGARKGQYPDVTRPIPPEDAGPPRQLALTRDDMVNMDVDALVCTTGGWLDMKHNPLSGAIAEGGRWQIQDQLWAQAPLYIGEVGVTDAGNLKAGSDHGRGGGLDDS